MFWEYDRLWSLPFDMFPNENELDSRICRKCKKKLKLKQNHNQTLKQKPKFMLTICCADTSLICLIPFRRVSMCVCVYRPSRVDCRPTNYRPPHNYTELDSFLLSLRFKCKISICNWYTIHPFALLQRTNLIWGFHQKKNHASKCLSVVAPQFGLCVILLCFSLHTVCEMSTI